MDEQNKTNDEQMSKQTQSTSDSNTGSSSVDYEKIADILDKRGTQAQYTALKGYLKEQGVSSDEMDKAIKDYKAKKEADKQAKEKAQADLLEENKRLKEQIQNKTIDEKISTLASGISSEKLPFLKKLVDRTKFVNEKGEVSDDEIKNAINEVVKAVPDFKTQVQEQSGFTKIGADGSNTNAKLDDILAKNFGLKK